MPNSLSRNTSIYLDFLRLLAAVMVFMAHSRNFIATKLPGFLFSYGGEAVAIFFVLSGFVISFVVSEKECNWRAYTIARISRIYPVVIVAILTTILVDSIGNYVNHSQYLLLNDKFHFYQPINVPAVLSYLTFTNQLWFSHFVFGTDEPFWSLGFEVWYYVIFGAIAFAPGLIRFLLVPTIAVICGPKILAYFPLWLLGFFSYKFLVLRETRGASGTAMFTASIILSLVLVVGMRRYIHPTNMYENFSLWQVMRNIGYYYAIGICVILNIISFNSMTKDCQIWSHAWERRVRWAAGASFTLYLVHQPIEVMISAIFPDIGSSLPLGLVALLLVLMMAGGLAELGERRKKVIKTLLAPLFYGRSKQALA